MGDPKHSIDTSSRKLRAISLSMSRLVPCVSQKDLGSNVNVRTPVSSGDECAHLSCHERPHVTLHVRDYSAMEG